MEKIPEELIEKMGALFGKEILITGENPATGETIDEFKGTVEQIKIEGLIFVYNRLEKYGHWFNIEKEHDIWIKNGLMYIRK